MMMSDRMLKKERFLLLTVLESLAGVLKNTRETKRAGGGEGNERILILLKEYTFKHWEAYYTK